MSNETVHDARKDARRAGHPRRRIMVVAVAAVAVIAAATVATAAVLSSDDEPPAGLQQALSQLFADGRCVSATQAVDGVRAKLDGLGYSDWTIASRPGAEGAQCVTAGYLVADKKVVLIPVNSPDVVSAMQGLSEQLMGQCLKKDQAVELTSSMLTSMGVSDFSIVTDGPLAIPDGQEAAIQSHIASGCFVYSMSGWSADGKPMYYLSGP